MIRAPKVGDIDDENNVLTKMGLTKNEYNATIRNKLEYNRLKVFNRHMNDQNDINACKLRTTVRDLRKRSNDNQKVVCNVDDFIINRKVKYFISLTFRCLSIKCHF
jgi:hypothetical protein